VWVRACLDSHQQHDGVWPPRRPLPPPQDRRWRPP